MQFDFRALAQHHRRQTKHLFDVVMMDPPWKLSSSDPTRGVTIAYQTMTDAQISSMDIGCLQEHGYLFIWTINSKFTDSFRLMKGWGYEYCDEICWIKESLKGKLVKGNGFYLQHAKESCLIGKKGSPKFNLKNQLLEDCIFSKRRGQSQKPDEIYDMIETMIPDGYYLEIFGRRNNLRNGWITIGNEL
eukprot:TRINITY_DN3513_c0_g1_i3.p1 TRINITY_DN3513_c0_g1~~TRINITY_DN3513_c0_g1_i3.p1  ORF type:complete len:189 (+),score=21.76 TRINITY_DN3513_c0_g1_i3:813-1379(+)